MVDMRTGETPPPWFAFWVEHEFQHFRKDVTKKLAQLHDRDEAFAAHRDEDMQRIDRVERTARGAARDAVDASGTHEAHLADLAYVRGSLEGLTTKVGEIDRRSRSRSRNQKWIATLGTAGALFLNAITQRFILPPGAPNAPNAILPGPTPTVVAITTVDGGTTHGPQ